MNTAWVASYVFAGVLIACAVLVMVVLTCIAINSEQAPQNPERATPQRTMIHSVSEAEARRMAVRVNDEELDIILQLAEARLREMKPTANFTASVNPDGSVAVARELSAENKSVV